MKKATSILVPLLALALTCLYPCAFQYFRNADEAAPGDMVPLLLIFLAMGAAVLLLSLTILRNFPKAGLFASLFMVAAVNSGLIGGICKRLIPGFRDRYLLLAFAVILLILLLVIRKKKVPATEVCLVLSILFGVLTVVQVIPAAPTLWKQITFHRQESSIDPETVEFQGTERPNVYYFLVDEYGGSENLERYYDFDNHKFLSFLQDHAFNISGTTKNTESIWTVSIMPNLLNMDYLVDDRTENKRAYMDQSNMVEIFRHNGYSVNLIDHMNFVGADDCHVLSPRQYPDTIAKYIYRNSVLSQIPQLRQPMSRILGFHNEWEDARVLQTMFDLMETCTDYVESSPTLTISYVQCPHYPFLFDAKGNIAPKKADFADKSIYLDQLTYLNTVLETSISNVLDKDPNAIIIVQSDHGTRYPGQMLIYNGGPDYDPVLETPYMQNALNVVYVGGKAMDIEGLSGINTLRTLMNQEFGTDFPMLEQPTGYTCYGKSWADTPDWLSDLNG